MPTGSRNSESASCHLLYSAYRAEASGAIKDNLTGLYLENHPHCSEPTVVISVYDTILREKIRKYVKRALIVALAFKNPNIPQDAIWDLDVVYIDGNVNNCHIKNLILKYPYGGIEHLFYKGSYYIPGYSNYLINREGVIYSLKNGYFKKPHVDLNGYMQTALTADDGNQRVVGLHRLFALTFLEYSNTVLKDVVNHKDLDRLNNSIENLEWCSQGENIAHGKMMRLRTNNASIYSAKDINTIQVKNLYTGEILEFNSGKACAKHFNCVPSLIVNTINAQAKKAIFRQKYVIKRGNQEWPDISIDNIKVGSMSGGRAVLVKNVITGEIKRYDKAAAFVKSSGLSKKVITTNLKRGSQVKLNNLLFKYEDNPKDWIS